MEKKCNDCGSMIETDKEDFACFLDWKYTYCWRCIGKDEIFEIMDEIEAARIEERKAKNDAIEEHIKTIVELKAVYDAAKQALQRLGMNV